MGLETFIALDDDSESENSPKFLSRSENKLKILQRHLARKLKGSRRWQEIAFRIGKLHQHIRRQRDDYQNKLVSSTLNKDMDVLVLEKLAIERMLKKHNLAKSMEDAALGRFVRKCMSVAKMRNKLVLFVDPWGTTQFCHNCLEWVPKDLSQRYHECAKCGVKLSRDKNSAKLIKRILIEYHAKVGNSPSDRGLSPAELKPLPSLRGMVSFGAEARSLRLVKRRRMSHNC